MLIAIALVAAFSFFVENARQSLREDSSSVEVQIVGLATSSIEQAFLVQKPGMDHEPLVAPS